MLAASADVAEASAAVAPKQVEYFSLVFLFGLSYSPRRTILLKGGVDHVIFERVV